MGTSIDDVKPRGWIVDHAASCYRLIRIGNMFTKDG